jgi:hypothetical protein
MEKLAKELKKLANKFSIENIIKLTAKTFDVSIQNEYIKLVQKRLYNKGTDKKGKRLRTDIAQTRKNNKSNFYSDRTIAIKGGQGKKVSNVTLLDEGNFYSSMDVNVTSKFYEPNADFRNIYENFMRSYSSEGDFIDAIMGLTEEDEAIFKEIFLNEFKTILLNDLK